MKKLPWSRSAFAAAAIVTAALVLLSSGCKRSDSGGGSKEGSAAPRGHISVTVYDRGTIPASEGTIENNKMTRWINEAGPVDVTFVAVPRTQSEQKLNTLFASGKAPDLILEYAPQIKYTLIDQKLLRPIDSMINQYSMHYKELLDLFPALRKAGAGSDGNLYQFGRINETVPQRGLFIRSDWLRKLNLEMPQTTNDLYLLAKAFTEQDPDGNGKKDTYGIAMSYNSGAALDEMFGVTYPDYVVRGGELVHGWDNIEAVTAFKKALYSEGLVDPGYLNDKNGARAKNDFLNGKVGIYMEQFNVPITFYTDFYVPLKRNVPEAELAISPYVATPVGRFNPVFVNPIQMTGVVNAETKDPEAVIQYIDFASSESFMKTMYYGFEGVHSQTVGDQCPQLIDLDKWKTEFNYASGDFAMLASPILSGACYFGKEKLSDKEPLQKHVKEMFELNSAFVDFSLDTAGPTHPEHMPQLPADLQTILSDMSKHTGAGEGDVWIKSILTPGYTPAQAKADALALWNNAGGKQVDDWYHSFYANKRDSIVLTKDIYDIFREQQASQQK
ncbi:extracellular solute-binding protein [Paenibacillus cymbidii]|uniref:extracellular solute-binding protein n=1 Tax=Paenibacillus cymbidii TaxID=1639034 RepID=UPI00107FE870|nr:extracellular solute-binding protein [Paenibacillus cymbidii]